MTPPHFCMQDTTYFVRVIQAFGLGERGTGAVRRASQGIARAYTCLSRSELYNSPHPTA
jgi:hypothetical protein